MLIRQLEVTQTHMIMKINELEAETARLRMCVCFIFPFPIHLLS